MKGLALVLMVRVDCERTVALVLMVRVDCERTSIGIDGKS